jgi:hypothetical protein
MEVTLVMLVAIFAINIYPARPVLDSFLFSLALAVGLTPQLLPAIKCVVLHSTDRGRSAVLCMTGLKFRDRVRREINHEHHYGRVDTKG